MRTWCLRRHGCGSVHPLAESKAQRAGVAEKVLAGLFAKFTRVKPAWHRFIDNSFLSPELRQGYHALLDHRFAQLGLGR